ncbi:MAG: hypothetical protein EB127_01655 [Alphaproteobacteria bacterium]|nr:hypothetical protein [Alphaproteobacteria bacterium]
MENQDFEHESQKDLVYLLEQQMQLEQEFWAEMNKKPAKIEIINESKTVHNESQESNILPF